MKKDPGHGTYFKNCGRPKRLLMQKIDEFHKKQPLRMAFKKANFISQIREQQQRGKLRLH